MRNIKFKYVPEVNMKVSAAFERKLENIRIDLDYQEKECPCIYDNRRGY